MHSRFFFNLSLSMERNESKVFPKKMLVWTIKETSTRGYNDAKIEKGDCEKKDCEGKIVKERLWKYECESISVKVRVWK